VTEKGHWAGTRGLSERYGEGRRPGRPSLGVPAAGGLSLSPDLNGLTVDSKSESEEERLRVGGSQCQWGTVARWWYYYLSDVQPPSPPAPGRAAHMTAHDVFLAPSSNKSSKLLTCRLSTAASHYY
jgi:hypothetical protein